MGAAGNPSQLETAPPPRRRHRWLLWTAVTLITLLALAAAALAILFHRAEPILRASIIDTLQKRFHARVELDNLRVSILDGFWVEGSGLRIWLPAEAISQLDDSAGPAPWRTEPWLVVGKLRFHASWRISPGKPIEISVVHIEGVRALIPPKADRPHFNLSNPAPPPAAGADAPPPPIPTSSLFKMPEILVRRIECQDAQLTMERAPDPHPDPVKPPKVPLQFEFARVTVLPDQQSGQFTFTVDMTNPKPVGTIHSTGVAGPWAPGDPGALPVEGDYHFDHADLSTIKGIAGMLSSTGHYSGTLREIQADGTTTTPDFRLERTSKEPGLLLTTQFHAIVDGTTGDTDLEPVDAMLGHTHILARGKVIRAADLVGAKDAARHGHDINLHVTIQSGRIEDILRIASTAEEPFLTGNLTLSSTFHLPPNAPTADVKVFERLELSGQFHLSQVRFSSPKMQGRIEQLSLRGQGKPQDLKSTDPTTVLSEMQGHFTLASGSLTLPDLDYQVPGAKILAHGTYGMQGGTLDFQGDARMDASLSQMVGGWKGLLLKPADRLLRKNGAGTDVPIKVNGTRKDPSFGVEFDRLGKTDPTAAQPQN